MWVVLAAAQLVVMSVLVFQDVSHCDAWTRAGQVVALSVCRLALLVCMPSEVEAKVEAEGAALPPSVSDVKTSTLRASSSRVGAKSGPPKRR